MFYKAELFKQGGEVITETSKVIFHFALMVSETLQHEYEHTLNRKI